MKSITGKSNWLYDSWILYKISILNRDACMSYIDGLAQDCSNSIAIALELLQS